ncbi:MAG: DUF131 domain-containing protein [archaeon GB-1845-036]|nr:DUF131 domain-containing protein [Candidatus Verstraetearchaeota archaeon]MCS7373956.1 DUF131 domain-containing protein [Candidatus Culexmicrobium thermophilum]HDO20657.1 DUF131 domain-containing protein [Candidatus Bathyarchaeota archaeon]
MNLLFIGFLLIVAGFIVIFLGFLIGFLKGEGKSEGGGIILIGPFPIVWGSNSRIAAIMLIATLIIMITILIFMMGGFIEW